MDPALRGRARRQAIGLELYDLMTTMVFATTNYRRTLFEALLEARHIQGGGQPIVEDIRRAPLSYNRLLAASFALGRELAAISAPGERVALLLPNSAGAAVAFFALTTEGRVPALLNYSTGLAGMASACRAAEIRTIVTARAFLTAAKLEAVAAELGKTRNLVYLEDIAQGIGRAEKLAGWCRSLHPSLFAPRGIRPDDPAVVLFTSGSEGTPKGVVLSHANILANRYQMGALLDFNPRDVVFNALPIFHSFGLTGGLLLPLLAGVKTFLYPSPLHYRLVPQLAYDSNATIFFGTDTFLAGYARAANAYDFYSLRYVFAGAERVREETRTAWAEKFGLRILEGYGATEMSPVIAVNTPMQFKAGTAGRFIPGIDWRLEPVPGVADGGRLILKGPNLMLGYLRAEAPGRLEPPEGGVYDTGDIVSVDCTGLRHHPRPPQALRQGRRGDGLPGRRRERDRRALARPSPCRGRPARCAQGRAAPAGDGPCRRKPRGIARPCPRDGAARAVPAPDHHACRAPAAVGQRQARLQGHRRAGAHGGAGGGEPRRLEQDRVSLNRADP